MTESAPDCYDKIELASVDELQALQLQRAQWSMQQACENIPFYKRSFEALGVVPGDLKELSDLSSFPLLTKQNMRDSYPFDLFGDRGEEIVLGWIKQNFSFAKDIRWVGQGYML